MTLSEVPDPLTNELKANIEVLKSLFKYYTLIQLSMNEFENYENFEKKSDIKVQIDYRSAPNVTIEQFFELRQELKFIWFFNTLVLV